jgi:lipoprotein-anchoring transpeptidase ErfK/SrfK
MSNTRQWKTLYIILILALFCVTLGIAAWTATSSPALGLSYIVTPTQSQPFAFVEIAKPIVTSTAVPANPPTPPATLQASEPMISAAIVVDTPASEYVAPAAPGADNAPAPAYSGNKYILVDISEQHMYVYEGGTLVNSFVSSTGMNNATRTGSFSVLDKIPSAYGATWDIWMPNWLGIYWAGSTENGIHALPILPSGATLWAGYLGVPISYGCVVLGTDEAQWLYDWADIGTPVEIQW